MKCAWLFLSLLLYFAAVEYREVNGLAFDDLDFARSAIESVAKSITSKAPSVSGGGRLKSIKTFKSRVGEKGAVGAKGWVVSARESAFITTKKVPTSKPRNLNKFNEAMDQVERAMAQAELSRKTANLVDLKKDIVEAVNRGNVRFARRALGIALYTARKGSKRRGKRSTGFDAKKFLDDIKTDLGDDKFSDFLALQGEVTLMFAIDVTGSMRQEIKQSKEIVKKISLYDRSEPVDFILTTFSDPIGLTTTVYYGDDEVDDFIDYVEKIKTNDGLDCPEYSFDGMINALYEDPRWGSPLYVFTDAPPKDADDESQETLRVLADDLGVTVHFFATETLCRGRAKYSEDDFKDVVEAYGGQYLKLDFSEFTKMAGFAASSLEGTTAVVSGKSATVRRKRRAIANIAVPVDDTVTKLIVTVTTENSPRGIQLKRPTGSIQTAGRTVLNKVIVFSVDNPIRGLWRLVVPSSVGKYEYSAKISSPENIDFEHYFSKIDRRKKLIPLRNPLAGQIAQVSLTVSGAGKIQKSSLLVDIIDVSGNTLVANKKLTEVGKSGIRFIFSLVPPNKAFKLLLKGKTKAGKNFQRISRHVDTAKPLVIKEFYTYRHYTIPQKGSTSIMFTLFNGSNENKKYTILFRTNNGYKASLHGSQARVSRMVVRKGSKKYIRVSVAYNGGTPGNVGETLNVVIIAKERAGAKFITTEVVPLMII